MAKKKRELPPLNQATPTLTGEVAEKFLEKMRETDAKADEFRTKNPEKYKKWLQEKTDWLNEILKKAKL